MIAVIAKPVFAGVVLVATSPALPAIDIPQVCAQTSLGSNASSCVADETYAKKKLIKYWHKTPIRLKDQCLSTAEPPAPSYVGLRDCINNGIMVKQIHHQQPVP